MKALYCNNGVLSLQECEKPAKRAGEVLIRVCCAGICSTDLEIIKGYIPGFNGILGHEFFGYVEEADNAKYIGKRVTAEINCGCGKCGYCRSGLQRHCPNRTVLGIMEKNGAFAEYIAVPDENATCIPDEIPDTSALFIEPLAAALEILEQLPVTEAKSFASRKGLIRNNSVILKNGLEAFRPISPDQPVLLVGDGRLAQLIGCVFLANGIPLSVVGKHADKLGLLKQRGAKTFLFDNFTPIPFDIVIEASGKPSGFELALACVKPRGTIVLKSTYAESFAFNPSPVVVNEITIIGSRCGRFSEAIRFLLKFKPDLSYLISARYPFSEALEAFERVKDKEVIKVVIEMEEAFEGKSPGICIQELPGLSNEHRGRP